jgi:prepilin-type N-terminal cleavage/methylation domain-containing protein
MFMVASSTRGFPRILPNEICRCGFSSSRSDASAFTLIELLVVIAIIAVLMGLLFPAFRGAQDQAKKALAKNDLTQIVTAVNAYYTEYAKYPLVTAETIYGPGGTSNAALFNELRAVNATQNPRQIVLISPPDAKDQTNPRGGIGTTGTSSGQYYDPWGTPYNIEIDGDYDNQISTNPYSDTDGSTGASPLRSPVIAWSYGKDGALGDKAKADNKFRNSDDVISWQ